MRTKTKRLLAMTGALLAATIGFGVWNLFDDHFRVTVVNRTGERYEVLGLTIDDEPTQHFALSPAESRTLRIRPAATPGVRRSNTSVGFSVYLKNRGEGIGFGASRWATVEILESPPNPSGATRRIRATFGLPWYWSEASTRMRAGRNPVASTHERPFHAWP